LSVVWLRYRARICSERLYDKITTSLFLACVAPRQWRMPEHSFQEQMNSIDQWISELRSLGVSPKRKNDMNDKKELQDLTENIKQELYHEYKTAYAEA
jgi:hypothetical protein